MFQGRFTDHFLPLTACNINGMYITVIKEKMFISSIFSLILSEPAYRQTHQQSRYDSGNADLVHPLLLHRLSGIISVIGDKGSLRHAFHLLQLIDEHRRLAVKTNIEIQFDPAFFDPFINKDKPPYASGYVFFNFFLCLIIVTDNDQYIREISFLFI